MPSIRVVYVMVVATMSAMDLSPSTFPRLPVMVRVPLLPSALDSRGICGTGEKACKLGIERRVRDDNVEAVATITA